MFSKSDGAHDYAGRVYKLMVVGTWISIAMFSFFDSYYEYLLPIWYLDMEWLRISGVGLVLLAFVWIIVAQFQMKNSWRIGIDYNDKTELIDSGLFQISRNPIFLGVIVSYIGTFLIIPNLLSFCIMVLTIVILQVQVRLEEEYLIKIHGDEYNVHKNKVRRWI
jgi:protein-S-isoprenylcysteine O-methyltransferase Ste14